MTNDLARRLGEHRDGTASQFTREHRVTVLVWFETHIQVDLAIAREKQIKGWNRDWKLKLIEKANPQWRDLGPAL